MVVVNQLKAQDYFNYQAIVSDANGAIVVSQSIGVRLSIIYDSSSGAVAYSEIHSATTDASGLINIAVGNGTSSDSYAAIDWSRSSVYLKSEIDLGSGYVDLGTDLIGKVPIALFAKQLKGITITSGTISATGANLSGTVTASAFVGDGSGLTGISSSVNSSTHLDSNYSIAIGGVVSATNSVAVGYQALSSNTTGSYNTAVGYQSLTNNTTGSYNSSNGAYALLNNTTGSYSTAVGYQSLSLTTTGTANTAIGYQSLFFNTSGSYNTALGWQSLILNTSGNWNTAIGNTALYSNSTGYRNSAIGNESLFKNTIGINNSANGFATLYNNTSGNYNTAHGSIAGYTNATGNYNTFIGSNADVASNNLTNVTALGANAIVTANNTIQLGDANVTLVQTSGTISATGFVLNGTSLDSRIQLIEDTVASDVASNAELIAISDALNSTQADVDDLLVHIPNINDLYGNTSVGSYTYFNNLNSNSENNTAIGQNALQSATSSDNTAVGAYSLLNTSSGSYNTAVGGLFTTRKSDW